MNNRPLTMFIIFTLATPILFGMNQSRTESNVEKDTPPQSIFYNEVLVATKKGNFDMLCQQVAKLINNHSKVDRPAKTESLKTLSTYLDYLNNCKITRLQKPLIQQLKNLIRAIEQEI